jgi:hypothetical protein
MPARLVAGPLVVNLHQSDGAASMPSSSQVFQAAYQLPHSQTPLATFPMTTPTFTPLRISPPLPPASITATQTTGSSVIEGQQLQAPPAGSLSVMQSGQALQFPTVTAYANCS